MVGYPAPNRREQELHERKGRHEHADDEAALRIVLAARNEGCDVLVREAGQERQHNAESDQINEYREKKNQQ